MTAPDRLPIAEKAVRLLRLAAVLSVIMALVAAVAVVKGDPSGKSHGLVVAAIALGACALIGMAAVTLPYAYRRKDRNDPGS